MLALRLPKEIQVCAVAYCTTYTAHPTEMQATDFAVREPFGGTDENEEKSAMIYITRLTICSYL